MYPDYFLGLELEHYNYYEISSSFQRLVYWGLIENTGRFSRDDCEKIFKHKYISDKFKVLNLSETKYDKSYDCYGFRITDNGKQFAKVVLNINKWSSIDINFIIDQLIEKNNGSQIDEYQIIKFVEEMNKKIKDNEK